MPTGHPTLRSLPVEQRQAIVKGILHRYDLTSLLSTLFGMSLPFAFGSVGACDAMEPLGMPPAANASIVVIACICLAVAQTVAASLLAHKVHQVVPGYRRARQAYVSLPWSAICFGLILSAGAGLTLARFLRSFRLDIPVGAIVVLATVLQIMSIQSGRAGLAAALRHAASFCTHCGYPLVNDETNRCPECGELR